MRIYSDNALRAIFDTTETIALVGASDKPRRASNSVVAYLLAASRRLVTLGAA
ncbi:CoA-binding protein [Pyruvatibacter sp.]|uniref:CoA-binding protein n=1 Tax=Pyruvatibacter sp. TaxID=1981328 RepID=UPI0032ECBF58